MAQDLVSDIIVADELADSLVVGGINSSMTVSA